MKWTVAIFESLEERIKLLYYDRQDNTVILLFDFMKYFHWHKNIVFHKLLWKDFLYRIFTFFTLCLGCCVLLFWFGIPLLALLGFDHEIVGAIIMGFMAIICFLFVLFSFLFHVNKYTYSIVFGNKQISSHSILKRKRVLLDFDDIKSVSSTAYDHFKGKYLGYGNKRLTYDTQPYSILIRRNDESTIVICINRREKEVLLVLLKHFIDLKINVEINGHVFYDVNERINELQR